MADTGFMWPQPPHVKGGRGANDPTCWAAALSSWQAMTDNRFQESIDELYARFSDLLVDPGTGMTPTLRGDKFHDLCKASNVDIAWKPITGRNLIKLGLEDFLLRHRYLYLVARPINDTSGSDFSHARVMFGAWETCTAAYLMDPSAGRVVWDFSRMKSFKFLLGVGREYIGALSGDGWNNEKPT